MLLSCLFLIGLSRDEEHNNSFVGSEGGESFCVRACAHVQGAVCDCVCAERADSHIVNWCPWATRVGPSIALPCPRRPEESLP